MLQDATLVAFVPTRELEPAVAFYRDVLGLSLQELGPFAAVLDAHGTALRLTLVQELRPHPFTVMGWRVADLADRLAALEAVGMNAMRYPGFDQDDQGIWVAPSGTRIAWFADLDDNVLSLEQHPSTHAAMSRP